MKPALAAAALVLALVSAEGVHRGWLRARGTPFDRAGLEQRLERERDVTAAFVPGAEAADGRAGDFGILHPFYGSEHHHDTGDVLRKFALRPADDRSYVVLVVGGSVAANWGQDVDRAFARRLEADPRLAGRPVRLMQFAHAAYKQPQQVTRLAYLLSFGYRPDAVINLDGFNEIASSVSNRLIGTHPNYPSGAVWGAVLHDRRDLDADGLDALLDLRSARNDVVALVGLARRWRLTASSLAGAWVEHRLGVLQARSSAAYERYGAVSNAALKDEQKVRQMHGPPFKGGPEEVLEVAAECWFQGSLALRALCAEHDVYYVHCLQPALHDPGSKVVSKEEEAIGDGPPRWRAGIERGYPLLRERGRERGRRGVSFHDVSQAFAGVEETLYFDPCHFLAPGNLILANDIAEIFLGGMPDPAARR